MILNQIVPRILVGAFLLGGGAGASSGEKETQRSVDARVGKILVDWQRESVKWTTVDVQFAGTKRSRVWDESAFSGRLFLLPKGEADLEFVNRDGAGKVTSTERFHWAEKTSHLFRAEPKQHLVWPIPEAQRGRLRAELVLPFFWHLSPEGLSARYKVELLKEEPETWVLGFTPLTDAGRSTFSKAFLILDRKTYLPRRYFLVAPDKVDSRDFRVTTVRCNQSVPGEVLRLPDDAGWDVTRYGEADAAKWPYSWFKPDLLP